MTKPKTLSPYEQRELDDHLIGAAHGGCTEMVQTLLANGADVHKSNDLPLWWAASRGHMETVQVLLLAGAESMHERIVRYATPPGMVIRIRCRRCLLLAPMCAQKKMMRFGGRSRTAIWGQCGSWRSISSLPILGAEKVKRRSRQGPLLFMTRSKTTALGVSLPTPNICARQPPSSQTARSHAGSGSDRRRRN